MSEIPSKPTLNSRVRNTCLVLAVTIVCFLIGGGWRVLFDHDYVYGIFYRTETLHEKLCAYLLLFLFGGGAAGLIGACGTTLVLRRLGRKAKA